MASCVDCGQRLPAQYDDELCASCRENVLEFEREQAAYVRGLEEQVRTLQQQNKQMKEMLQKATNEIDIMHPKNLRLHIAMFELLQSIQGGSSNDSADS